MILVEIVVIAHNIRSIYNVGSIFRTCEGFGVKKIYLSGYTPSPDHGLPHVRVKTAEQLHKTALGAEKLVDFEYITDLTELISSLGNKNYRIVGLEQDPRAIMLPNYYCKLDCKLGACNKVALILGEEVHGISQDIRNLCDDLIEIPMVGQKESFNVSVATGIALYALTY
ncbi:RNA methyltransferase [Alphaproteobacteria bacterium]|nr:RNA methyltransferase [Alphaproteobacteria bacterium]